MTALILYFVLTSSHTWEFMAVEPTDSPEYCELLAGELQEMFVDQPGNMRVVCTDDLRVEI